MTVGSVVIVTVGSVKRMFLVRFGSYFDLNFG